MRGRQRARRPRFGSFMIALPRHFLPTAARIGLMPGAQVTCVESAAGVVFSLLDSVGGVDA
jgi:hypothetical protein